MLYLKDVHFAFGERRVLRGVSFRVGRGEIVSLIGISGSGKTTLFRLITGALPPHGGQIEIEGSGPEEITYMRQEDLLLPWRTVLDNMLLFTELGGEKRAPRERLRQEALALLQRFGMEGCEEMYPEALSGGMRQRVSLARALLQKRPFLLLDEPFGSLDLLLREELYTLLKQIRDKEGKTLLLVTHDFRDALTLSDRILVLREGSIAGELVLGKERNTPLLTEQIRSLLTIS